MSQQSNEIDDDISGESQNEYGGRGGRGALRMRQLRMDAQVQLADAQKMMARATAKSARYMLWAAIACATSSVITVIAVLYGVLAVLPRVTH
jgi:hypothetical protein